jgi:nucleoside-diphosphate-sugar epimerase
MRILVLGGSVFLGRHFVEAAIERGHRVTVFNRGRASAVAPPGAERLIGDRTGSLVELEGRRWDAVLDTSGYLPSVVRASADALALAVETYLFVSSISAYADFVPGMDESAALAEPVGSEPDDYGALKTLCEREVHEALPGRALVIRPGLIVGPLDPTDRFTYWVRRMTRGGEVLAPGAPSRPVQLIDVRDLAEWLVRMIEEGVTGTFNATGPEGRLTFEAMLECCGTGHITWVPDAFLLEHGVEPFSDLPLWLPADVASGFFGVDSSSAIDRGLRFRPLAETARDTHAWDQGPKDPVHLPKQYDVGTPGLEPDREAELLRAYANR